MVPRGAEAELFVVGAELEGSPVLFLVESGPRARGRGRPVDGRARRPLPGWSSTTSRSGDALLGERRRDDVRRGVRLSRLAWCALAVGTGQAVLDYVTPYVKEREAFGEPIAHRQSVAFMVADIAIELQAMRLLTYKAAGRPRRARTSPARSRWPGGSAPRRACRSVWTACSCSAATASSRSTRSSGGTATSRAIGLMEGGVMV